MTKTTRRGEAIATQKSPHAHAILESPQKKKRKTPEEPTKDALLAQNQGPSGWEEVEAVEQSKDAGVSNIAEVEKKPLSKHTKKKLKDDKERAIRDAERRRLEGSSAPTTAAEFKQLVLASPNSSFIWIKYMAFLISLGEVDRARAVAERAIQSINYREEGEKFNVWVAWLNTENTYGNEESALQLLHRALTHTDPRRMYLAALDIFDRTDRSDPAEECIKAMCRKFSAAPEVWLRAVRYRLTHGDADAAKKILDRSLQSLPRHEHVRMASQTALLEFKVGDPERGRSMFEGVLQNYPRRLDLWSVYLDQEIAQGDAQRVRALFERATHLTLPAKKMKFMFKRYLDYEKAHGDDAGVEHVKKRAMEFVERAMAG